MDAIADYAGLRPHGLGARRTFLAEPPARLGRRCPVVLRVLDPLDPPRLQRALEELRRFAAVGSPFLIRVLDAGHEGERAFYAVEHLGGGTLAEPAGELEPAGALKVVADASRGAHALHEAGMAHGAISPATVILDDEGGKLGEPGPDRRPRSKPTVTGGTAPATLECTDPAIVCGEEPGRASDIWSLGVTLHRAVSGRGVYGDEIPAGDLAGAVRRMLSTRPAVADRVDPAVATIVSACVQADPDDRPQTALAVAELLEDLL